jgi:type VI secretion system protein ImpJ
MNETMNARDIPAAIHWHEGLLLTPQHFQQLTSRQEALVQYSASVYSPYCWGLRRFKHQGISLSTGKFQVTELEAVMPDGLLVSYDVAANGSPLEVDLAKYKDLMADRALPIYLAVMAGQSFGSNGNGDRYEQFDGGLVEDAVSNARAREIFRVRPKLTLVPVPETLPAKYIGFPIAKLRYTDTYRLDDEFIPPILTIPASGARETPVSRAKLLTGLCSAAAQRVRDRASILLNEEARGANRFHSLPDGEAARLEQMIKAQRMLSVVGALPVLEAMLQCGGLHPLSIYFGLCALAGHLAVFGTDMIPDRFEPYDHNDLYLTFKRVIDFIERKLDEGLPVSYKSFHFHFKDHSFQLHFDGAWMGKQLALAIHGPREMSEEALKLWGESSLIASEGKIQEIRKKRTTGVPRMYAERVGEVGPRKGVVLFALPDTKEIDPNQTLHILNDGTWPNDIVLHVLND